MTQPTDNKPGRTRIQQLLAAIGSRACDEGKQVDAVDYDWHQPHFFNAQQGKKLAAFTANAATLLGKKFGNLCQHGFEVTIISTSEHFAGQFLGQEPTGQAQGAANYYLPFRMNQEVPCGFVSIPPQTALVWATQLLGDTAKENTTRPLSDLEASFLFDMAKLVVGALAEAGENCGFNSAADVLANVLPLQLKGSEEFYKITFRIKKDGSETASEAHILILCEKLARAIGEAEQATGKFTDKEIARAMQGHIEKIPVPVTVQLACVPVTVEQLLNLSPGDVLLLDKKINDAVHLIAAGRTVCRGLCAKSANNYAMYVTESVPETT